MIASPSSARRVAASGREALKDGGVFVRCAFPYKAIVNFLVRVVFGSLHGFFMEGSILAQDERWRRAQHMQVERDPGGSLPGESGERVSNA